MALGNPFVLTIGAKMAGIWFGDHERALATTIISVASVMGIIFGFVFPTLFITDKDREDPELENKLWLYVLIQSSVITGLAIPIFFLIRNKPSSPPSKSAKDVLKMKRRGMIESMKKLLVIPNYWVVVASYSCIFSIYIVLGASVGAVSNEFGYKARDNSIFGAVFVIAGVLGSIVNAILLDKYGKFKLQY